MITNKLPDSKKAQKQILAVLKGFQGRIEKNRFFPERLGRVREGITDKLFVGAEPFLSDSTYPTDKAYEFAALLREEVDRYHMLKELDLADKYFTQYQRIISESPHFN